MKKKHNAELATEVYSAMNSSEYTDYASFRSIGFWLVGAILRDSGIGLTTTYEPDKRSLKRLKKLFPPSHGVWKYVRIEE